jgi:TonB family protein
VVPGVVYTLTQVDEGVQYLSGPDPKYPPALRAASIEGRVTLRFIVDPEGKVRDGSIQVINSTNSAFEEPAKDAIKHGVFRPAKVHGQPVSQLVEQVVVFQIK